MALRTPPSWLQNGSHPAENDRLSTQALYATTGIIGTSSLAVTQNGTPNMSVNIAAGWAAILGTSTSTQGVYVAYNDAATNTAITTAPSVNSRIDLVCLTVSDSYYSGVTNAVAINVVAGTVAASPVVPSTPANSIALAQIAVGTNVTSIVTANITDLRVNTTTNLPVVTLTGTQTLTNKTLTTPIISSISNTGLLTLPTSTDTIVGRATIDTLTNKTLTSPFLTTPSISNIDAKGDVLVGTADNTLGVLTVGSDGSTLVANSASATGMAWAGPTFTAGKNKIINGDFGIWQRGTNFVNIGAGNYSADRWNLAADVNPISHTISQQVFDYSSSPASDKLPIAGYNSTYFLRSAITTVGSTNVLEIQQRIENVRTFAGQTVTLSFWAKADSARSSLVYLYQNSAGTGSAYSATPTLNVTTSWQRYSFTFTLGSISGFTIGANSSLYVGIRQVAASGSTLDLWGVQLEAGSVATPFTTATGTLQGELTACQRYYWRQTAAGAAYTNFGGVAPAPSTTNTRAIIPLPVQMRVTPTVPDFSTLASYDGANILPISSPAIHSQSSPNVVSLDTTVSGATQFRPYSIISNNSTSAYLGFSAEL